MAIMDIMVGMIGAIVFSLLASVVGRSKNGFSYNTFLGCFAICIAIMVWVPIIPSYFIVLSASLVAAIIFSDKYRSME